MPVKLFARQFGSYVDIGCTLANCAHIWTPDILDYMRKLGDRHSAGMVEGLAEGLVKPYDVRTPPAG